MIGWLAAAVVTVTVAVWSVVLLNGYHARRSMREAHEAQSWKGVQSIIVLAWLFWVLPSIVGLAEVGRPATQFTAASVTPLQTHLQTAISVVLVVACFRLILKNAHRAPKASIWRLAAFLAPWFAIVILSGVSAGYVTGRQFLLYPLVAVTIWLVSPPLVVIGTVGVLGALTAAASLAAAFVTPLALVAGGSAGIDKAIVGNGQHLLAGPYSDANGFAITLALSAPCLLVIRSRTARVAGLLVIALALLWCAGRTSLIAAAAGFSVYFIAGHTRTRALRLTGGASVMGAVALVALTPLLDKDPRAFTSRGTVWALSLADWRQHHFWLGGGPLYYERSGLLSSIFSFKVIAGHNLLVDSVVRGGIVGAVAVSLLLVITLSRALTLAPVNPFPLAFVVTFAFLSWLEVPLNLTNLGFLGYASWIPLAVIAFTRGEVREASVREAIGTQLEPLAA